LYIKYLQIFRQLESCYDNMIHPQKRIAVKEVLEHVIRRILELKCDLVKWNPPNSYVRIPQGAEEPFPWEYVHLDDILVDLKLSPEMLEIPIPKYFKEDVRRQLEARDRIITGYMKLKHNVDKIHLPDPYDSSTAMEAMTLDRAIEIIQRNERGRQGQARAGVVRSIKEKERQGRLYESSARIEMDADIAATNLQRMLKGFISRTEAARERENELMFIGMKPRKDNLSLLENELNLAYIKRKQEQLENKESYEKALDDLKEIIMDEEGPEKREELREERTLWVTDQIAQEKFPEDLEDFYKTKQYVKEENDDEAGGAPGKDAKKDAKGGDEKGKGKKDDKKGGEGGGKKGKGGNDEPEAMPKLQGKTELTESMLKSVKEFEDTWDGRDESDNFQQKHDIDLGKTVVRPGVYEDIRQQVDEMLIMNLKKIKMQVAPSGKGKKGGKKKGKGKKGKKGGKGKKKKPLPGEKIAELKGLDTDAMLSMLIEYQLVVKPRQRSITSLIGEFNYLGSVHHNADRKEEGTWEPQDPSMAQIRQSLTEYCILQNGSNNIKEKSKVLIKSLMLYGPSGSGKTHAVEAIAYELGGLLIHLSPAKLKGQFGGKTGPTKLVHLVMSVARDPTMQPCIIYIDECEQFFTGGKKAKDKESPARFKKDLLLYKNQALGPEHRVMIIGTSKFPENGETKDYKSFFDKFLYLPYPDYASRVLIWRYYIMQKIRDGLLAGFNENNNNAATSGGSTSHIGNEKNTLPATGKSKTSMSEEEISNRVRIGMERLDISSLAHISEGYSAGAVARTVRIIITTRRVAMMKLRPLMNADFIDTLAMQDVSFQDDKQTFMDFTKVITGLVDRRKKVEAIVSGDTGEKKKGDKKGKK
jgi:hypothetical protein